MYDYCHQCPYSIVSSFAFGELTGYSMRCSAADKEIVGTVFDRGYLVRFQPQDWCPLRNKKPRDFIIPLVY